jgi:hypothetical protein
MAMCSNDLSFVKESNAVGIRISVWPVTTNRLLIAGSCIPRKMLPTLLKINVAHTKVSDMLVIVLRLGTLIGDTFKTSCRFIWFIINNSIKKNGIIIANIIMIVVLTSLRALSLSFWAIDSASLLRNPFPNPMSN